LHKTGSVIAIMKFSHVNQLFFILTFSLFLVSQSYATEEFAERTGDACDVCHVNPSGGGELTAKGKEFKAEEVSKGTVKMLSPFERVVRLIVGYLHAITGIVWFGTIFYVHLFLKPAYASAGLPKGEMLLGWISIIIIGTTGTLLTISRVPSMEILFGTQFGILLIVKISLFLIMVLTAAVATLIIGPKMRRMRKMGQQSVAQPVESEDLTIQQLSGFDGKEGRRAYVGYKGNIYDVTESRLWKDGSHMRKHIAGFDLTDAIALAPHEEEKITEMPLIGALLSETFSKKKTSIEKVFYVLAYTNLVIVFLVVFIIALWRWW